MNWVGKLPFKRATTKKKEEIKEELRRRGHPQQSVDIVFAVLNFGHRAETQSPLWPSERQTAEETEGPAVHSQLFPQERKEMKKTMKWTTFGIDWCQKHIDSDWQFTQWHQHSRKKKKGCFFFLIASNFHHASSHCRQNDESVFFLSQWNYSQLAK